MTIAVVYGPNEDKPSFFENLFQQIESFGNTSIVVGGDWNVPLNYDKDTYNYKHNDGHIQKCRSYKHPSFQERHFLLFLNKIV